VGNLRDERALVDALRAGDERAFAALVDAYGPAMLRLAQGFVRTRAVAEEVVQETWLGVLKGLDRFEKRSSLKTWIFRILTNVAKTRGEREGRSVPFSSLAGPAGESEHAASIVGLDRFAPAGEPAAPGMWASPPSSWDEVPEERLLSAETRAVVEAAIAGLPDAQRTVISLRDVQGWTADEVCNVLDVSETNQRVLLHRARTKVRRALEQYLDQG
jgi:RNA polymerase sigma-70 factor (ECF subfamily)